MEPKLVEVLAEKLKLARIMTPVEIEGEGTADGPANFRIFGRGPADKKLILDFFLQLLAAGEELKKPLHVCRTYKLLYDEDGTPFLAHGYTIAGAVADSDEANIILDAFDTDFVTEKHRVDKAEFYQIVDGKPVPSGPRNIPTSYENGVPVGGADVAISASLSKGGLNNE